LIEGVQGEWIGSRVDSISFRKKSSLFYLRHNLETNLLLAEQHTWYDHLIQRQGYDQADAMTCSKPSFHEPHLYFQAPSHFYR